MNALRWEQRDAEKWLRKHDPEHRTPRKISYGPEPDYRDTTPTPYKNGHPQIVQGSSRPVRPNYPRPAVIPGSNAPTVFEIRRPGDDHWRRYLAPGHPQRKADPVAYLGPWSDGYTPEVAEQVRDLAEIIEDIHGGEPPEVIFALPEHDGTGYKAGYTLGYLRGTRSVGRPPSRVNALVIDRAQTLLQAETDTPLAELDKAERVRVLVALERRRRRQVEAVQWRTEQLQAGIFATPRTQRGEMWKDAHPRSALRRRCRTEAEALAIEDVRVWAEFCVGPTWFPQGWGFVWDAAKSSKGTAGMYRVPPPICQQVVAAALG